VALLTHEILPADHRLPVNKHSSILYPAVVMVVVMMMIIIIIVGESRF